MGFRGEAAEPAIGTVLLVGAGPIAVALAAMAEALGWTALTLDSAASAVAATASLTGSDAIVVLSRDPDVYGPALVAALSSAAGYLAAKGSRSRQAERAGWLRAHGISDERIAAIRGPAGLPIGAATSAEIAASIVADIIAVRRGAPIAAQPDRVLANG